MENRDRMYIQDIRGYVGNSVSWWAKGGSGYTTNIDKAEVFTEKEAMKLVSESPEKYRAWSYDHIQEVVTKHVDVQNLDYRYSAGNDTDDWGDIEFDD